MTFRTVLDLFFFFFARRPGSLRPRPLLLLLLPRGGLGPSQPLPLPGHPAGLIYRNRL